MGFETARSNGLVDVPDPGGFGVTARAAVDVAGAGVRVRGVGPLPSPSLTSVSTDRSKSSLSPRRTISFRLSLLKPISLNAAIFDSNDAVVTSATGAPRPAVFLEEGGDPDRWSKVGDDLDLFPNRRRFEVEDDDRRPKPKNLPDLGGSGGGDPSGDPGGDPLYLELSGRLE